MTNRIDPKVDEYLDHVHMWREEIKKLRSIMLDCELDEELKWRKPCYMVDNRNVAIIQAFKNYCAIMFFKGALLKDPHQLLIKPGEHSQAQRQLRFSHVNEIEQIESTIKSYIEEAIENEVAGHDIKTKGQEKVPEELQWKFDENPAFKEAFESLTPGRQRAYIIYFSKAKKSETRTSRIEKHMLRILDGRGLND